MTSFDLKIIALISMLIDHSTYILNNKALNYFGRIAFPIFAFQTTISYQKTKSIRKYLSKLFIFALVSEIPYMLFFNDHFNILFTLLIGNFCLIIYDKIEEKALSLTLISSISIIANIIGIDYGFYGIWLIVLFYIFKDNKKWMNISVIVLMILYYIMNLLLYSTTFSRQFLLLIFTLSSLVFINMYNNEEGKKTGYLFYIIYPLHLIIFYIIKRML